MKVFVSSDYVLCVENGIGSQAPKEKILPILGIISFYLDFFSHCGESEVKE